MFEFEDPAELAIRFVQIENIKNPDGETPLYKIAKLGLADLIPQYISQGSTLLVRNNDNETVLDAALKHNQCEFAKKIIPYFFEAIKNNYNFQKFDYENIGNLQMLVIAYYHQDPLGEFMQNFSTDLDANIANYINKCNPQLSGHETIYTIEL